MEQSATATRAQREKKDSILIARISGKLKRAIARRAESEGSITAYIERLVKKDLQRAKINLDS